MKSLFLTTIASLLLMQSMCYAQDQQSHGIPKTISGEIVFVPLSAIQPQTISKPLSKKALLALLTVGGTLGKLLLKNNAGQLIELLRHAFTVLFREKEKTTDDKLTTDKTLEDLVSLAQLITDHAQELLEN